MKQLERGRDSLLHFDDQFDVSSSNPELLALGAKSSAIGGPDAETTAGINTSLPSKEQRTARSSGQDVGESKRTSMPAALDGSSVE